MKKERKKKKKAEPCVEMKTFLVTKRAMEKEEGEREKKKAEPRETATDAAVGDEYTGR